MEEPCRLTRRPTKLQLCPLHHKIFPFLLPFSSSNAVQRVIVPKAVNWVPVHSFLKQEVICDLCLPWNEYKIRNINFDESNVTYDNYSPLRATFWPPKALPDRWNGYIYYFSSILELNLGPDETFIWDLDFPDLLKSR